MSKTQSVHIKFAKEVESLIPHFTLPSLLPSGHTLAVNKETRTVSLLSDGPTLVMEQQLSANEIHMLVPILESFPHYCPYEVLLSHMSANIVTAATIAHCRQRLQEAQEHGLSQQELRPIRRALSSLRTKLHRFDLEISNIRERGWSLTSLTSTSNSTFSM